MTDQTVHPIPEASPSGTPTKSFLATWLLSYFLGVLGVDRFYLGKVGTGVLKLLTLGGFGVWWLIDLIITLAGAQKDKSGQPLEGYERYKKIAWIVTAILVVISIIFGATRASSGPAPISGSGGPAVEAPSGDESAAPDESEVPTLTNGDHIVGTGVAAGQYRAEVESGVIELCTVSQSEGDSIVDIRNANEGSVIFTVQDIPGSVVSFSGCENIALAADMIRENPSEITNGDWLVGLELAPGQYQGAVDQESIVKYGSITQTSADGSVIDIRNGNEGNVIFTVQDFPGSVVSFQGLTGITKIG